MTLKEWMRCNALTQVVVAEKIGVHQSTVARWINYQQFPDPIHLVKIKDITGGEVTADNLVNEWVEKNG